MTALAAPVAEKGSVAAWESIWRAAGPGLGSAIVRDAVARGDDVACVAGLLRSAFGPEPPGATTPSQPGSASAAEEEGVEDCLGEQPEPAPSARAPVPYNEFPEGF